ncbi:unnamed protein product [Nesidiocoris tenuis]|uniref:CCHC-type domain-containing protein n=1 Tax=Nesidiocoris tenuis TaxID=355587 RepID=A0A6H5HU06_9HEMI|nr:unnamed protein product [Nesidiocoris tenuis]CAB0020472.1 unnamed protein product [Nesidiocoris tenuis]
MARTPKKIVATTDETSDGGTSGEDWAEVRPRRQKKKPSFAQMVRKEIKRNASSDRTSSIIVSNPNLSPQSTRKEVMKTIDPASQGLKIRGIRNKGNEGVMITTGSPEDTKKIRSCAQLRNAGFSVQETMGENPKLRVHGVQADLAPEEVKTAVFAQNFLGKMTEECFTASFKPSFKTGKRGLDTVIWVIEVSPEMRRIVLEKQRLYIKWDNCWVADFVRVTRCFRCQAFDHVAKYCKGPEVCKHCSKEGHREEACASKADPPKCSNCRRAKEDDRHAVSSEDCPAYKWALRRKVRRTNYKAEQIETDAHQPMQPGPQDRAPGSKRDREEGSPQGPSEKRIYSSTNAAVALPASPLQPTDLNGRVETPASSASSMETPANLWKVLCRHCLKYGHNTSQCYSLVAACEHCGLEGHKIVNCPNRSSSPRCAQCIRLKMKKDATKHSVLTYEICPAYRKHIEQLNKDEPMLAICSPARAPNSKTVP